MNMFKADIMVEYDNGSVSGKVIYAATLEQASNDAALVVQGIVDVCKAGLDQGVAQVIKHKVKSEACVV